MLSKRIVTICVLALATPTPALAGFEAEIDVAAFPKQESFEGKTSISKFQLELPGLSVKTTGLEYVDSRGNGLPLESFDKTQLNCFRAQLSTVYKALKDPEVSSFLKRIQVKELRLHMLDGRLLAPEPKWGIKIHKDPSMTLTYFLAPAGCVTTTLPEIRETIRTWITREESLKSSEKSFTKLEQDALADVNNVMSELKSLASPSEEANRSVSTLDMKPNREPAENAGSARVAPKGKSNRAM